MSGHYTWYLVLSSDLVTGITLPLTSAYRLTSCSKRYSHYSDSKLMDENANKNNREESNNNFDEIMWVRTS